MTYDFTGKTAVVTGASRGIGAAIARTLAEDGARVVLVARSKDKLDALAAELPNNPVVVAGDLVDENAWKDISDRVLAAVDGVDILVNNAGVSDAQRLRDITPENIDKTLNVNVRNLILLTGAFTASLSERKGSIVNISSVSSFSGAVGQIAYATSKGAVNSFTRNASIDLGSKGVRINAVAPGLIDDGMWQSAFDRGLDRDATFERMKSLLPLEKRWGSAQNIADAVAFLASDKANYITGQTLRVDGGMTV